MCARGAQPLGREPRRHVCVGVCPALRQELMHHMCAWFVSIHAATQAPRVPT